jgi:hypothetical protein
MSWLRIAFDEGITHAVHNSLAQSLVLDMAERGMQVKCFETAYGLESARTMKGNPAPLSEWAFDFGGMTYVNAPREVVTVDGLSVTIDCDAFPYVLRAFEDAKIRRFADGRWYYKLKFWIHATVLTPEQRDAFEDAIGQRQRVARERWQAFRTPAGATP